MNHDIDSVNHVGMAVRNLADATARYESMGFVLTPFSPHSGAWKPGEAVRPLGSGNRCVMFANNYLEILANADPHVPSERLAGYLRHHEGAHIICFNTQAPASVDARLHAAGLRTSGVIPLQRDIETDEGMRTARFERVQFSPEDSPEGYIQAARHLTPEYIYQPRYTGHPNGCTELSDVYVIVDDVDAYRNRYERYTGVRADGNGGMAVFRFSLCGSLTILSSERALDVLPGTLRPPVPGIAGVAFRCPDVVAQRRRLEAARIHAIEADGRLVVPAELANGVAVVFEAPR